VTVIVPAHNEQASIGLVLDDLASLTGVDGSSLIDDVVVCNNASTDHTGRIARDVALPRGWSVIDEEVAGYGAACGAGVDAVMARADGNVRDKVIVFVDGDRSVDPENIRLLLAEIVAGAQLVIGCRLQALREAGAMTPPQRLGNWIATVLIRLLWQRQVTDLGPLRAITLPSLVWLGMRDRRFGWTVEMQIRAIQESLVVVEVPVTVRRRIGKSKISGTARGVLLAGYDIIGTILKLRQRQGLKRPCLPTATSEIHPWQKID